MGQPQQVQVSWGVQEADVYVWWGWDIALGS